MDVSVLADELNKYEYITFAVLFGSFAAQKETSLSDVDIAIYTDRDVDLLEIGRLTARIEKLTKRKVDLLAANDIFMKNPVLAYEIASSGKVILSRDEEKLTSFRRNSYLQYLDTAPLRRAVDQSFIERLKSGNFGRRNYA